MFNVVEPVSNEYAIVFNTLSKGIAVLDADIALELQNDHVTIKDAGTMRDLQENWFIVADDTNELEVFTDSFLTFNVSAVFYLSTLE